MVTGGRTLIEDSPFLIMSRKVRIKKPPIKSGGGTKTTNPPAVKISVRGQSE